MTDAELHEEALVRSFIIPAKRHRMLYILQHKRRRAENLKCLYHFGDLVPAHAHKFTPASHTAEGIEQMLRSKGAPETCYVISTMSEIDGRFIPLAEALAAVLGIEEGTLLSCVPGRLGYFEGEVPSERYVLEKTGR